MKIPPPLRLMGAPGSPYTRKMLALLRYRRIPYHFYIGQMGHSEDFAAQGVSELATMPKPRVELMPTFYLPANGNEDDELIAVTDSTPLIRRFEADYAERGVVPPDTALAVIDELLEDFADEWLTKSMFHYRWTYSADIEKARRVLPFWQNPSITDEAAAPFQKHIGDRQIERLPVVGSNEVTQPVIEQSYQRIIKLLDKHLTRNPFLMGQRPGSCDFAFTGQLTALAIFDPTPSALVLNLAPRVYAWVERLEDLSGLDAPDDGWLTIDDIPATLHALLKEVGRCYVPVMLANEKAVEAGVDTVNARVDGRAWMQKPFPYQVKCLRNLRASYASLSSSARKNLNQVLDGTGCDALFAEDM